jgi:DNA-binding MarR family transcriptional regulator
VEFDYSDALTHLMGHIMKLHRHNLDMRIQAYDVFPGQPQLLIKLSEEDGQIQKELARKIQVTPATLTVMVTRMVKSGLVVRKSVPNDQRISKVFLTEKGRRAASAVKKALREIEAKCFEHFNSEEQLLLRRLLLQMHTNLEDFKRSKH